MELELLVIFKNTSKILFPMTTKEVTITYETLFELLRREKGREDLQALPENFFEDVVDYLKDKSKILEKTGMFAEDEVEKTRIQLQNIKKIIKELYDRREKKITVMALDKARTQSNIIDTSSLLGEELSLFNTVEGNLSNFRQSILHNIINQKIPEAVKQEAQTLNITLKPAKDIEDKTEEGNSNAVIKFLHAVPKFVGKNLEIFGPFMEGETTELPKELAEVLVKKERAEYIS